MKRRLLITLDQGISSGSNLLLTVAVARSATALSFGQFVVVYGAISFFLGLGRAVIGEPLVLSSQRTSNLLFDRRAALGLSLMASAGISGMAACVGLVLSSPLLVCAALALGSALFQDTARFAALAGEQWVWLCALDLAWLVLTLGAGVGLQSLSGLQPSASFWLLMWSFGALGASLVGLKRCWPKFAGSVQWIRRQKRLSMSMTAEHLLASSANQILLLIFPFIMPLDQVAAYRVGQTVASPATILVMALTIGTVPEVSRTYLAHGARATKRIAAQWSLTYMAITTTYGLLAFFAPSAMWHLLFGDSWRFGKGVIPWALLSAVVASSYLQVPYLFRVSGLNQLSVRIRGALVPVTVAGAVAGAEAFGAAGATSAIATAGILMSVVWWLSSVRLVTDPVQGHPRGGFALVGSE